jgi:hypothetical protein
MVDFAKKKPAEAGSCYFGLQGITTPDLLFLRQLEQLCLR